MGWFKAKLGRFKSLSDSEVENYLQFDKLKKKIKNQIFIERWPDRALMTMQV